MSPPPPYRSLDDRDEPGRILGQGSNPPPRPQRAATVLESVEEAREIIRQMPTQSPPSPQSHPRTLKQSVPGKSGPGRPPGPEGSGLPPSSPYGARPAPSPSQDYAAVRDAEVVDLDPDADTVPFRPTVRPGFAILTVFDDGSKEGELIRIRKDQFVIGRESGDLVIPHDSQISHSHAEICRRWDAKKERFRWYLRDLASSNGTFARVQSSPLQHLQELIIGSRRLRFVSPPPPPTPPPAVAPSPEPAAAGTMKWQRDLPGSPSATGYAEPPATIVEIGPQGEERRFPLVQREYTIGRNPQSSIYLDDPMTSPLHARLTRDAQGVWNIENNRSLNGLWLRVNEVSIDRGGHFQCGEQRFLLRIS